jgi:Terminase large subunit, T4likevirus-type, N-terminal
MWRIKENSNRDAATQYRREPEVSEWVRTELGFEADETQARVLNSRNKRMMLNCARQWGKSTVTAAKAVHEAYTHAGSLTLAVSPTARQTGEFLRKAQDFMTKLGLPVKGDGDNEMSLAFPRGSRIVGLPGTEATVRGFSAVALMLVDEASRVSDELYRAIRPMMAVSGGTLWLLSTPFGKRGFFHEAWAHGGDGWERVCVRAEECGRIPASFLAEERMVQGERWYRQEYGCEFIDGTSGVFDRELLEAALTSDFGPLEI